MMISSINHVCGSLQTKFSHLDVVGRPVVVLEKTNVVPEHNQYFQVLSLPTFWVAGNSRMMAFEIRPLYNQIKQGMSYDMTCLYV